ncbi:hypothetical protein AWZ03_005060 [Drosophila navojoa]|uniref:Secreted protein n=1 Tax=Drosophila navojoa TaxID=7232 RepID=A0A484BI39_DRONA|nr:hypothetical protein AWZ03_005060 [Drosophila navojoa]
MEISLHLKPFAVCRLLFAVCRLIYCRLSPDCQLSTTNPARPTQASTPTTTAPTTPILTLELRHPTPVEALRLALALVRRRVDPRRASLRLGPPERPIGRAACPPNAAIVACAWFQFQLASPTHRQLL